MKLAFLLLLGVFGCRDGIPRPDLPPAKPVQAERQWCADIPHPGWIRCADALVPVLGWPNRAIVCVDSFATCVTLGELRLWLKARAESRPAEG